MTQDGLETKRQCTREVRVKDAETGETQLDDEGHEVTRRCRNWAVVGSEPAECRFHLGGPKARIVRQTTKLVSTQGKIAELLNECDLPQQHPLDGLLEVVRHAGAMTRMLAGLVGQLDTVPGMEIIGVQEDGSPAVALTGFWGPDSKGEAQPHVYVQLYGQWADRYARACKLAADAGIDERMIRNAEATTQALFGAVSRAIEAAGLDETQVLALRSTLAEELRRLSGATATLPAVR